MGEETPKRVSVFDVATSSNITVEAEESTTSRRFIPEFDRHKIRKSLGLWSTSGLDTSFHPEWHRLIEFPDGVLRNFLHNYPQLSG
ncbi:hypothetical protein AVEN_115034-1 [Araneus ventricosus]|uniref:Uncharacterized protein n=1 Tax=Araneus ventricosus TaxID=182803 RepID=A0A4Y1ZXK3_ARAVE|nr:hypothetical protein AVEN_115034-1 [Araneus ventricosus]